MLAPLVALLPAVATAVDPGAQHTADRIRAALVATPAAMGCTMPADSGARWRELDALTRFYGERGYRPFWSTGDRLDQLLQALDGLVDDGLDPRAYGAAAIRERRADEQRSVQDAACLDLLATHAYLSAFFDLALGNLDPVHVEPLWRAPGMQRPRPDCERLIDIAVSTPDDVAAGLARARPAAHEYHLLRKAHGRLREQTDDADWQPIPGGPLLREGMTDPRVPVLRARLEAAGFAGGATPGSPVDRYDAALAEAVADFQQRHGLAVDAIVGPETLEALNASPEARRAQIAVNLERMRWLAGEQKDIYLLVDVAGARIQYFRQGEAVWTARAQVGQPTRRTPLLKSEITHLTFNPTWTIPPTILRNDALPEIRRDIGYLARNRIRVLDRSGDELPPESVDWNDPGGIVLRQDAGPHSALGRVAIRFPNPFHVYLHDTPNQQLFAADRRAFSSGCVRVERAMELVDLLVADGTDGGAERAEALRAGRRTVNFDLPRPVPILIAYWTASVDDRGEVVFRPDLYGRDDALARALSARQSDRPVRPPCSFPVEARDP
ncbi:L,D-transpeptidase family protein [Thioalkalivibrio paradoxus]|uniref:Peptidoglycan-binding protein n=1 Tax=Thioalkalivibrio paradoxus ARh 1 TaxID=713585 RepID=W0DMS0_9GAMM|nr:L,D-transpeptidase family protein [Thioalkalivibrio paradoxus]AHE98567.1 peptidoglycan-binding protein [Thioalkalivibrio paradoxus ARh 1]